MLINYFMLNQCLENMGEGLLHACISSLYYKRVEIFVEHIPIEFEFVLIFRVLFWLAQTTLKIYF